jgi:hypothetical protein
MGLATNRDEVSKVCECLTDVLKLPLSDTLNIKNGLSYSQVLESIFRIAYMKLEESDYQGSENGLKIMLEQIFQDANIDIR